MSDKGYPNPGKWWKIYAGIVVALSIGISLSPQPGSPLWAVRVNVVESAAEILGLVAYIFQFRVLRAGAWKIFLPLGFIWDGTSGFFPPFNGSVSEWVGIVIGFVLRLPLYIALYRYAWRSPHLWNGG